jgi:hypothetical protein
MFEVFPLAATKVKRNFTAIIKGFGLATSYITWKTKASLRMVGAYLISIREPRSESGGHISSVGVGSSNIYDSAIEDPGSFVAPPTVWQPKDWRHGAFIEAGV